MTYFKKFLIAASLAVASLSANAVLITQDINVEGFADPVATFTVEFDDALLGPGVGDVYSSTLVDVEIFGLPATFLNVQFFNAIVDGSNVLAGLQNLYIDVDDQFFAETWAYQLFVDVLSPETNLIDIFVVPEGELVFFEFGSTISFGEATFVPEPSTIALFGLALLALGARRRLN